MEFVPETHSKFAPGNRPVWPKRKGLSSDHWFSGIFRGELLVLRRVILLKSAFTVKHSWHMRFYTSYSIERELHTGLYQYVFMLYTRFVWLYIITVHIRYIRVFATLPHKKTWWFWWFNLTFFGMVKWPFISDLQLGDKKVTASITPGSWDNCSIRPFFAHIKQSNRTPTYPWIIPRASPSHQMKEIPSYSVASGFGECSRGMLGNSWKQTFIGRPWKVTEDIKNFSRQMSRLQDGGRNLWGWNGRFGLCGGGMKLI